MSFLSVLEAIGKGFAKGLKWAVTYAVPVERLAALLFPSAAPVAKEIADATTLIQNAVLLVEQKARQTLKIADRAYLMETGRVITSGPAKELIDDPVVSETFLGGRAAAARP